MENLCESASMCSIFLFYLQFELLSVGVWMSSCEEQGNQMETGATFSTVCCSQLSDDPARNMKHKHNSPAHPAVFSLLSWVGTEQRSLHFFFPPLSCSIYPNPVLPSNPPLIRMNELLASLIKWKQHAWMKWKAKAMRAGCEAGVKAPAAWPWLDKS